MRFQYVGRYLRWHAGSNPELPEGGDLLIGAQAARLSPDLIGVGLGRIGFVIGRRVVAQGVGGD